MFDINEFFSYFNFILWSGLFSHFHSVLNNFCILDPDIQFFIISSVVIGFQIWYFRVCNDIFELLIPTPKLEQLDQERMAFFLEHLPCCELLFFHFLTENFNDPNSIIFYEIFIFDLMTNDILEMNFFEHRFAVEKLNSVYNTDFKRIEDFIELKNDMVNYSITHRKLKINYNRL